MFAVERYSICIHCTEAVELRKVLGWLHCQRFYSCEFQPGKKKGEYLFAIPAN